MHTLILGIGNDWATDDGVGPQVVHHLQGWWNDHRQEFGNEVGFVTATQPDLILLDRIAECHRLIIVDAVVSGAPPGTLHHEVWRDDLLDDRGVERTSSHGFGVRELLTMAAVLNKLPQRVELWGVEIASTEPGQGLTPEVAQAAEVVVHELIRQLADVDDALQASGS